ncbi:Crp/Fnr family transcriptional regulator [Thalassotalea nanhaiensis]|uniref:Crp/Fnr family transcriptional regulator n=1 Tax=Thalassotalea nanhaiensis TaxID=3065648 RepID=A0ABY9TH44_9GAMM|nr:Crp/Fnr family transcriptional regulator [Colwelliaceae bacterium SQ345]
MSISNVKVAELLKEVRWPCDLSEEFKQTIVQAGMILTRNEGYYHLTSDLTNDGLFYLLEGSVIISIRTSDFDHFTYKLLGKGDFLYYGKLMDYRLQESINADFLQDSTFLKVTDSNFVELTKTQPEIYKLMFSVLKKNTLPLVQKGVLNQKFSIPIKVAFALLDVASKQADINGVMPMLTITQQQLANLADVTRPRVNAVLKEFACQGLVEIVRGKVYLLNVQGINDILVSANLTFYSPTIRP